MTRAIFLLQFSILGRAKKKKTLARPRSAARHRGVRGSGTGGGGAGAGPAGRKREAGAP